MSWMLNRLPPYSGIRLSTSKTLAFSPTSRRARLEPIKPRPPVIRMFFPLNSLKLPISPLICPQRFCSKLYFCKNETPVLSGLVFEPERLERIKVSYQFVLAGKEAEKLFPVEEPCRITGRINLRWHFLDGYPVVSVLQE